MAGVIFDRVRDFFLFQIRECARPLVLRTVNHDLVCPPGARALFFIAGIDLRQKAAKCPNEKLPLLHNSWLLVDAIQARQLDGGAAPRFPAADGYFMGDSRKNHCIKGQNTVSCKNTFSGGMIWNHSAEKLFCREF
jgi:hypothetical protein